MFKSIPVLFILLISGCCPVYDLVIESPGIDLVFRYGSQAGEFDRNDSVFRIRWTDTSRKTSFDVVDTLHPGRLEHIFVQTPGALNMIRIEGLQSGYQDTVFAISVQSREKQVGRRSCHVTRTVFFNMACTYNGTRFLDPEHGTLVLELQR